VVRDEVAPNGVVSRPEAARLLGESERTIRRKIEHGIYQAGSVGRDMGSGRAKPGLLLIGMALERARAQREAERRERGEPATVPEPRADLPVKRDDARPHINQDGVPLTAAGLPDLDLLKLTGQAWRAAEYRKRRAIVDAVLDRAPWEQPHGQIGRAWKSLARDLGLKKTRLCELVKTFKNAGAPALVPPSHKRGSRAIPEELKTAIRGAFLTQQKADVSQVFREIVVPFCVARGVDAPCQKTVERFVARAILPVEAVYYREGKRPFEAGCAPKSRRETPPPGQVWSMDNRLMDTMVLDGDKPCRPWLTCVWDCGSGGLVGYRISRQPNAAIITSAIRRAIEAVGVPRRINRDNGRDFCARRLGGKAARLRKPSARDLRGRKTWPCAMELDTERGLFDQLGIQLVTSLPYRAWSKPAESLFAAFQRVSGENLMVGWTGRDAKRKPEALKALVAAGKLLTLDQYREAFGRLATRWNEKHTVGGREAPPAELLRAANLPRVGAAELGFLCQAHGRRKVSGHAVTLDKQRWVAPALAAYTGCSVACRWDAEADDAFAYVDGQVLVLHREKLAAWGTWGAGNREAKRGRAVQMKLIGETRRELRDAPFADPSGSFAIAAERLKVEAAAAGAQEQHAALAEADQKASQRYPEAELTIYETDGELLRLRVSQARLRDETKLSRDAEAALLALVEEVVAGNGLEDLDARDEGLRAVHERIGQPDLLGTLVEAPDALRRPFQTLGMCKADGTLLPVPGTKRARTLKDARGREKQKSRLDVSIDAMTLESAYLEAKDLEGKRQRPNVSARDLRDTEEWTADLKRRLAGVRHVGGTDPLQVEFLAEAGLLPERLAEQVAKWTPGQVRIGRAG